MPAKKIHTRNRGVSAKKRKNAAPGRADSTKKMRVNLMFQCQYLSEVSQNKKQEDPTLLTPTPQ